MDAPQDGAKARLAPRRPSALKRLALWAKRLVLATGILVLVVTLTPLVPWWAHRLSGPIDPVRGDAIIVLASADSTDGILSYSSYLRGEYALRAWREGWGKALFISGGVSASNPAAIAIADFLKAQGVPASALILETSSDSTRENALDLKPLLTRIPGQKVLITSDYHMYRARKTFEAAGISVLPRPFPDAIKRSTSLLGRWPAFCDLCLESAKIGYYRLRGWIR